MDKQGENKKHFFKTIGMKEILFITALFIFLFYGGQLLSFHFLGKNTIKEEIITFNTKSNNIFFPQPTNQIYLSDEQFNMIQADIDEIKKSNETRLENNLSVSTLNDFYSSLFTAIAVIVAVIALISWRGLNNKIMELENATREYMVIKPSVDYLIKKNNYAKWVQQKFTSEDIEYSYDLNLSEEDKAKYDEMESHITELHEDDAWMEMIIAHEHILQKDDIIEAEKIYKFIESRNIFPDNSMVEPILYHLLGQLYKKKYDMAKDRNIDIREKMELLKQAEQYYIKSLDVRKEKDKQRTRTNLAVVYIELGKQELKEFYDTPKGKDAEKPRHYLNKANEELMKAEKQGPDYNIYWDQARVAFYLNGDDDSKKIKDLLVKAVNNMSSSKAKESFINKLNEEIDEFKIYNQKGFPGDRNIICEIEDRFKRT
ncbi:MAG: hypothetical protein ABFC94_05615 [Syntrophomonas sp.]